MGPKFFTCPPGRSGRSSVIRQPNKNECRGLILSSFPKVPDFQQVTLKVLRWEERDKRLVIKDAELMP
jgi:hypothetical protein